MPPAKGKKTVKKYGLTLTLPEKLSSEIIWLMADAEQSDSPFAEVALQARMVVAMVGEKQAQKVRDANLSVEQLAILIGDIQDAYGVDEGK